MAQTGGCEQYDVGTPQWEQCIRDQATGGGLMPWIVVVPLAVMVVGMMIGFARQFSSAGRRRAREQGAAGTAGSWLIFVAFIELAIGIGSYVAERRAPGEGGGFSIAAVVLLGVGVILLVAGVWAKAAGRRRARIYHHGIPGEAIIRAVHETGTMVNNQPMYAFDLDVTGSGFPPTSTTHREVVPFWFASRVGPDARVPVKVDPTKPTRLIFDWERFRPAAGAAAAAAASSFAGGGGATAGTVADAAAMMVPGGDTMRDVLEAAGQLRPGASEWHVGKAIGAAVVLFVIAVVGGGLYLFWNVFGSISDTTADVTEQVEDAFDEVEDLGERGRGRPGGGRGGQPGTRISVSRAAADGEEIGYSVALPVGWNDLTGTVPERQGAVLVDVVFEPPPPANGSIIVTRSLRYLQDPAPKGTSLRSLMPAIVREFGGAVTARRPTRLDGTPAVTLEIAPSENGVEARQVVVLRGGQILFVALTAPEARFDSLVPVFEDVLDSWDWSPISAR